MWDFIANYLPNYSSRDDVLRDDILFRYINSEDVCDEDLQWIEDDFKGDKSLVIDELIRLETGFMTEAIGAYYKNEFAD